MNGRRGVLVLLLLMALTIIVNSSYVQASCDVSSYSFDGSGAPIAASITTTCVLNSSFKTSNVSAGQATLHSFGGVGDTCDSLCGNIIVNATNSSLKIFGWGLKNPMNNSNEVNWTTSDFLHWDNVTLNLSLQPSISVYSPINTTYNTSQILVNFSATVGYGTINTLWFYNGSANTTYTTPVNVNLPDGAYTFIFYANTTAGDMNQTSVSFTKDTVPPSFNTTQLQPVAGTHYNQTQTVPIVVSTSEASTVTANVSWDSTSQLVSLTYNGTNWYYNSTFTNTLIPGQYNITITATDGANNTNTTTTNFIVDDVTAPAISITTPTPGTVYNQTTDVRIQANITDPFYNNMGTAIVNVTWDSTYQTLAMAFNSSSGLYEATFSNTTTLGTYIATVRATDNANNTNTSVTNFTIADITPPSISIISPQNTTYNNLTILVNISASDLHLQSIWYNWNGTNVSYTTPVVVTFVNGSNKLTAWANDTAGNVNTTSVSFYIDTSLPTLIINSPLNTTYNNRTVLVNLTSNGVAVWYNWNGTNVTYSSAVPVTFNEGVNTLTAWANNSIGNVFSQSVTFSTDTTPPSFNTGQTQPTAGTHYNQTQTVPILISASESISAATANVSWDSTSQLVSLTSNGTNWYYNGTFTNTLYPGRYNVTITALDIVNNTNTTTTYFIVDDVTAPGILITSPTTGQQFNQTQSVPIKANVTDPYYNNMGTVSANVTWDSTGQVLSMTYNSTSGLYETLFTNTAASGRYNITITAKDNANNTNTSTTYFLTSDNTPPSIVINSPQNITYNNLTQLVQITANDNVAVSQIWYNWNGTNVSYSSPVNVTFNNGSTTLTAWANDTSGNVNTTSVTFYIDTSLPTLIINSPQPAIYNNRTILVNITSTGVSTWYDWNGTNVTYSGTVLVTFAEGVNTLTAWANNSAGNVISQSVSFTTDTIAPGFNSSQTQPANGTHYNQTQTVPIVISTTENSTVTANLTWDSTSQLVNLTYNGTQWYYTYNFTNTTFPGQYNITITIKDQANNTNTTTTSFIVDDVTAPSLQITAPTTGQQYNQTQTVPITANVSDPYYNNMGTVVANVTYDSTFQTLNMTYNSTTGLYQVTLTNTSYPGVYNITIIATDNAGNKNTSATNLTVNDVTAPSLQIVSPTLNQVFNVSQIVPLTANVTDPYYNNMGTVVANVTWDSTYQTVSLVYNSTTGLYQASFTNTTTIGSYNVTIVATDLAGNSNTSTSNFSVHKVTPPSIQFVPPTETSGSSIVRNYILTNVTANDSYLANITIRLYNSSGSQINMSTTGTSPLFMNFTNMSNALYFFNATACDSFGNCNSTETRNVTIIVSIDAPQNFTAILASNKHDVVLNWSVVPAAQGYRIWSDTNVTYILNLNYTTNVTPNVTLSGANNNSWIDTTANQTQKRFYAVAAYNANLQNMSVNRTGKFDVQIPAGEGMISFPLVEVQNFTDIFPTGVNFGARVHANDKASWIYNYYDTFSGQWDTTFGFQAMDPERGYWTHGFTSSFNITNAGIVPTGNVTTTVPSAQWVMGWQSLSPGNFTAIWPTGVANGARVHTYNGGWIYNVYDGFGGVWDETFGFQTMDPGRAYWTHAFNAPLNITYTRNG